MVGSVNTPGVGKAELDRVKQTAEGAANAAASAQTTADNAASAATTAASTASAAAQAAATAQQTAEEAKQEVKKGGVPVDADSTVAFSLGCDANGVYMTIPDSEENEGGSEA